MLIVGRDSEVLLRYRTMLWLMRNMGGVCHMCHVLRLHLMVMLLWRHHMMLHLARLNAARIEFNFAKELDV